LLYDLGHLLYKKRGKYLKTTNASDCSKNIMILSFGIEYPLKNFNGNWMFNSKTLKMKLLFSRYFVLFELIFNHLQLSVELVIKMNKTIVLTLDLETQPLNTSKHTSVEFPKPLKIL